VCLGVWYVGWVGERVCDVCVCVCVCVCVYGGGGGGGNRDAVLRAFADR
jgi:hypothetical protein